LKINKNYSIFAFCFLSLSLLLSAAVMSYIKESSIKNAVRLMKAMRLDEAALLSLQLPYLEGYKRNPDKPISNDEKEFLQCLKSTPTSIYSDFIVDEITEKLSADEVQDAIEFFEGRVGVKMISQALDTDNLELQPEFTDSEAKELSRFKMTSSGNKILLKKTLYSTELFRKLNKKNNEISHICATSTKHAKLNLDSHF
jgi:hypothetical protein